MRIRAFHEILGGGHLAEPRFPILIPNEMSSALREVADTNYLLGDTYFLLVCSNQPKNSEQSLHYHLLRRTGPYLEVSLIRRFGHISASVLCVLKMLVTLELTTSQ